MLAVQREVKALIFEPETPGGFRCSIDCRTLSSSATAEDILESAPCYNSTTSLTMGGRVRLILMIDWTSDVARMYAGVWFCTLYRKAFVLFKV